MVYNPEINRFAHKPKHYLGLDGRYLGREANIYLEHNIRTFPPGIILYT